MLDLLLLLHACAPHPCAAGFGRDASGSCVPLAGPAGPRPDTGEPDTGGPDSGGPDTGQPASWTALSGACEAPAELPGDPLARTAAFPEGDPDQPTDLGLEMVWVEADPEAGRIYAAGQGGLVVVQDSGGSLELVDQYPSGGFGRYLQVELLDGGLVAVTNRTTSGEILDAGGGSVQPAGHFDVQGASGMAWSAPYLYVLEQYGALHVLDLSDPEAPGDLARMEGLSSPWEIVLSGERAYVADNGLGVAVVDISDPVSPVLLGSVPTAGGAQDLDAGGGYLYVATGSPGIEVFSLSDPDSPRSVAILPFEGSIQSVSLSGDLLWASYHEDVVAVDVSSPEAPVPLASEATPHWAMHVAAAGSTAYVADWGFVERWDLDPELRSPELEPGKTELYFYDGSGAVEIPLRNQGGAELHVLGGGSTDPRVSAEVDGTVIPPGDTATLRVSFQDDGRDLDASLCVVSDDPDEPTQQIAVASTSGSGSSVAVGQPAPDFALPDAGGELHRLSDQLGHPVVLVYFATW